MKACTIFLGPCGLLMRLLGTDKRACRLYDRLNSDKLVVSSTKLVQLDTLYCTQQHIDGEEIATYVAHPRLLSVDRLQCVSDLPVVLRYKGKCFVLDGHHRLAAKLVQGVARSRVYFWDLDALLASRRSRL